MSEGSTPAIEPSQGAHELTSEARAEQAPPPTGSSSLKRDSGQESSGKTLLKVLGVLFFLYCFLLAIKGMGSGLKTLAKEPGSQEFMQWVFGFAVNPFVGFAAGILVTTICQSSSFTTALTITLVANGSLTASEAVFIIMGANIGTSVTNTIVSLTHWSSRREFRAAFAAAIVHDIFNFLCVIIFLPLEMIAGVLSTAAQNMASWFQLPDNIDIGKGVVSYITKPVLKSFEGFLTGTLEFSKTALGVTMAVAGVILLFVALVMLVKVLKSLVLGRLESLFKNVFFSNSWMALVVGVIVTILVQSSSVTTSLIVPFVGAGLLSLSQVFPFMVGANIGTTCTGLLAAAALPTSGALMVAFAHLLFNIMGAGIFVPLRSIPVNIARRFANFSSRNRLYAILYILGVFFALPFVCIYLFSLFME